MDIDRLMPFIFYSSFMLVLQANLVAEQYWVLFILFVAIVSMYLSNWLMSHHRVRLFADLENNLYLKAYFVCVLVSNGGLFYYVMMSMEPLINLIQHWVGLKTWQN